ncbi:hypothetical protein PHLCEN_2v5341 [Hermanssonia centrifuga]|uniref:Alginate lyase domain-containing protein n=1 Tax=Hermanssonia centrifuga TaxID=98765 RepID=A0A2R6P5L0_9APHY|nr:hypothetical protein PHLCEN_2v5341 [Hermanssonia centrifuga]
MISSIIQWFHYSHWPDCNWCSKGATHFANPNATVDGASEEQPNDDSASDEDAEKEDSAAPMARWLVNPRSSSGKRHVFGTHHRMKRVKRMTPLNEPGTVPVQGSSNAAAPVSDGLLTSIIPPSVDFPGTTTSNRVAGTDAPAQAPAKTQTGKPSCTPSPTKSLAPSASTYILLALDHTDHSFNPTAWTTCPYIVRDGKVNPDTNTLAGPDAVQGMAQSVLYNAIAYTLHKTSANSQNVAKFIDNFFLSSVTGMHPNVNFGQQVRGPGKDHQVGTFTGILDIRSLVKVVNALQLMRSTKSSDWTPAREQAMSNWMNTYVTWLQGSDIGKQTSTKANNHFTFYTNQVAAAKIFLRDTKGAADTLQHYFTTAFLDQVAQSGEQPFESVRTRPFHYRCFNLEAMITNAKLGDQIGLNLWTAKSKYGATIQTALDYTMSINPKGEDISDIFPLVASIAAAYGDPTGKYASFLQKNDGSYKSQPYWFYSQTAALVHSPAASKNKRDLSDDTVPAERATSVSPSTADIAGSGNTTAPALGNESSIPFTCPAVFANATAVEVEDGLYVTCKQLRPFYEIPMGVDSRV